MADFNIKPRVAPSDNYDKLDAYELTSLYMESESGGKVDLKPLYQTISFVEDMSKVALSGSVLIKDAVNLFDSFPISGYEKIHITFRTPGIESDFIKKSFDVTEITDRVKAANERAEVYRIKFVSPAVLANKSKKISKSFTGKISDIAKKIYSEYIGGELSAQETKNEQRYVVPRWSPFKAIEWLSQRAIPAKKSPETNYMFFENLDGHQFVTISELCDQDPAMSYFSVPTKVREPGERSTENFARLFSNVKNYRVLKTNQKLKEFMDGAYSSVLYVHDVTTKQWGRFVYDYNEDEDSVRRVSKEKLTKNKDKYTENPAVVFNLTTKQTGLMGKDYPDVQNHEEWLQRAGSQRILLDSVKVKITVSGNSRLRIGDVVELFVPKTGSVKKSDTEWYDPYYSGRYLVTTLRHTITQDGYTNTMLLSKNGYETGIPDKSTFMGTSKNTPTSNVMERK